MIDLSMKLKLDRMFNRSPVTEITDRDRVVVVSDLHMGDGSFNDDFKRTSNLFTNVFSKYYLDRGFQLVLNGDVEELHKFIMKRIIARWNDVYDLFLRFQEELSLYKLVGNHDLMFNRAHDLIQEQYRSIRMKFKGAELFFLHGHQASNYLERLHYMNRMLGKTLMNPLRLKNFTLDLGNKRLTRKEHRLSSYSLGKGILTFVGHTHRPLFGVDSGSPLLYNSGAAIGKNGITTLEIDRGRLNLVHWWDRRVVKRYLDVDRFEPERLGRNDVYRVVLNSRRLTDIFSSWGMGQSKALPV